MELGQFEGSNFPHGLKTEIDGVVKQLTHNTAVVKLNQTTSVTYAQAEVQAIADKVDELIQLLKDAGITL